MEEHLEEEEEQEQAQVMTNNIPLFIKKLWKMVNDKEAENIISWNETGDAFVIHNQLEFITKLLPQYFKHNNMASFVRQLNFYNFHKVPNVNNEIQFSHVCFLKDVPEVLSFIRRKNPVLKQKGALNKKTKEVEELLADIKNLKGKHTMVDKELALLKQENAALWNELNSLRIKYTKQSTIINMLIQFLITYIHSHQSNFSKTNIVANNNRGMKNIRVAPKLLEIGYKNNKKTGNTKNSEPYTVVEPGTSSGNTITYSVKLPENRSENQRLGKTVHGLEDILNMTDQTYPSLKKKKKPLTYSIKLPNQREQLSRPEIQRSLLEILKENERLCEEETDEIVHEMDSECDLLDDSSDQLSTDDIMVETPEDVAYTISYPADHQESGSFKDDSNLIEIVPIKTEPPEEFTENVMFDSTNNITSKVPVTSVSGIKNSNVRIIPENNKIKVLESQIINSPIKIGAANVNKKAKFIKVPVKNIKKSASETPVVKKPNVKHKNISSNLLKSNYNKPNIVQNINSPETINPESALLEILEKNKKISNNNLQENPSPESTNIEKLLNDQPIDDQLQNFYIDNAIAAGSKETNNTESASILNRSKSLNKDISILENPKENLNMYVENTQEEIDMLQDILNDLTSKDVSEILSTESSTNEPMDQYLDIDESVDNYFKEFS